MKVVWTKQAKRDIEGIHHFIAADSEFYATEVVDAILRSELRIAEFPTAGSAVRERLRKDFRQVRRYSYRIIYRIRASRIDILTVAHEKQQLSLDD